MTETVKPILSVCIPTYNRAAFLRESLTSVFAAINGMADLVEVVISDNASTDDTFKVVEEFQSRYPTLRYNRNKKNVLDKNYFIAAALAKGSYVWIFADDDLMAKEAVSEVLGHIRSQYNLILVNYSIWNNDFTAKIKDHIYHQKHNVIYKEHNRLLAELSIRPQFLSHVIFKKETIFKVPGNIRDCFHDYGCSFLLALYWGLAKDVNALLVVEPMLQYRGNNSGFTSLEQWFKCFATGSTLVFKEICKQGYSSWSVYRAKILVLRYYLAPNIINNRQPGNSMSGILWLILPYYLFHFYFWMIVVPLLVLPVPLLQVLRNLVGKLKHRHLSTN